MKTFKQTFFVFLLTVFGCSDNGDLSLSHTENGHPTTGVDPNTPADAQPFIVSTSSEAQRVASPPGFGWVLDWSDEFDGNTLNSSKWNITISSTARTRPALGVNDWWWVSDHVFLDGNGKLTLRATKEDYNTMYCGSVDTKNIYEPTYGFIETRMKIAETAKGNHTAFWFQGHNQGNIDGTGNDGAEIDVVESAWSTDFTKSVIHIDGYGSSTQASTNPWDAPNIHSGYHTYGLNWTPTKLEIYYDGVKTTEYTDADWIPDVSEWIWLSVGASFQDGDFVSQPTGLLSDALVDYVRVWTNDGTFDPTTDAFRLVNKQTGKWIKTYGVDDDSAIKQANPSSTGNWTQWTIQYVANDYFYFVNTASGKYFRPVADSIGSYLQLKPTSFTGSWTQWQFISTGDADASFYVRNKQTGKYIRPQSSANDDEIIQVSSSNTDDWVKWILQPVN